MFSVRTYLVLMNVVVLCFLFPTVSGYYWNKITELRDVQLENTLNTYRDSMEARGGAVVQSMSLSIREAVAGFNFSFINLLLRQVVEQDPDLQICLVFDDEGIISGHSDQSLVGAMLPSNTSADIALLFDGRFSKQLSKHSSNSVASDAASVNILNMQNKMYVASPVYSGGSLWGVLRCDYSTSSLREKIEQTKSHWQLELKSMRYSFFSIALVFFIFAVLVTVFFTGKLVKAIANLKNGVDRIADGDLNHKISPAGLLVKEFFEFAHRFNQMTNNLRQSYEKLDSYNRTLEDTVKLRTKELEAANSELKAFSYSVSHDLRAPLRSISGFSSLLIEDFSDDLSVEAKQYLNKIQESNLKMDDLITGMLTLSRAGHSDIDKVVVDVTSVIKSIVAELQRDQPDVKNNIVIQNNLSTVADYKMLNIVFNNIISNAWKYSAKKEAIKIEIGLCPEDKNVFFVKDNGAGFDMKYVDKLFNPFQRLHKAEDFEGTGIGLATVYRIISRHSGEIWVDSHLNEGTTFFFSFVPVVNRGNEV